MSVWVSTTLNRRSEGMVIRKVRCGGCLKRVAECRCVTPQFKVLEVKVLSPLPLEQPAPKKEVACAQ
jgi:hypothetical protein